jgi:hypothetical protein
MRMRTNSLTALAVGAVALAGVGGAVLAASSDDVRVDHTVEHT